MKLYFACAVTGRREDEQIYRVIVEALLTDGHQVLTAHLVHPQVMELEAIVDPVEVFGRDICWIQASDALIAEVSTPSHGVGFEIAHALSQEKPVLCCFRYGVRVSKMITGNPNPNLQVRTYRTTDEAVQITREFLSIIDSPIEKTTPVL